VSSSPYVPSGSEHGVIDYSLYEDDAGYGLVTFAGVMLSIAAVLNLVYGFAAIGDAHALQAHGRYIFGNLHLWGWFQVAFGALQAAAAGAIWKGVHWGRWFGVACASVNAILQTFFIPAYPIMAMVILALDITVIYALLVYGGRRAAAKAGRARAGN
jgi:uncharacterized membrane protein (DUF2068 family)